MLSNLNHLPNFRVQIKAFEITSQQRLRNFALCITLMRGPYMIYKKGKLRLGSANLELKNWLESWSREPREVTWSTYMGYNIYHPIWSSPLTRYRNMSRHPEKPPCMYCEVGLRFHSDSRQQPKTLQHPSTGPSKGSLPEIRGITFFGFFA